MTLLIKKGTREMNCSNELGLPQILVGIEVVAVAIFLLFYFARAILRKVSEK